MPFLSNLPAVESHNCRCKHGSVDLHMKYICFIWEYWQITHPVHVSLGLLSYLLLMTLWARGQYAQAGKQMRSTVYELDAQDLPPLPLICIPVKSYNVNGLKAEAPDMYFMLYLFSLFSLGVCIANNFIFPRLFSLMLFSPSVSMQSTYRWYNSSACVFLRKLLAETTRCANTWGSSARNSRHTRGTQYWHDNNGALPGEWK